MDIDDVTIIPSILCLSRFIPFVLRSSKVYSSSPLLKWSLSLLYTGHLFYLYNMSILFRTITILVISNFMLTKKVMLAYHQINDCYISKNSALRRQSLNFETYRCQSIPACLYIGSNAIHHHRHCQQLVPPSCKNQVPTLTEVDLLLGVWGKRTVSRPCYITRMSTTYFLL